MNPLNDVQTMPFIDFSKRFKLESKTFKSAATHEAASDALIELNSMFPSDETLWDGDSYENMAQGLVNYGISDDDRYIKISKVNFIYPLIRLGNAFKNITHKLLYSGSGLSNKEAKATVELLRRLQKYAFSVYEAAIKKLSIRKLPALIMRMEGLKQSRSQKARLADT